MTTKKSQKSKKYVVTKMVRDVSDLYSPMKEKQLCRFDTLQECAEFIVKNDECWYNCRYGKEQLNMKLSDCIIKLKALESDFS
jgi:hypothetical protein